MNNVLSFNKKRGETPLQALDRLRMEKKEYSKEKLSYAGRLDPLAEGVMLVLVGEANNDRKKYLEVDKTYITEILLGISTDTGDVLGLVKKIKNKEILLDVIKNTAKSFIGEFKQKYPAFSSKTVLGRQLHEITRVGERVKLPSHTVALHMAKVVGNRKIKASEVLDYALDSVDLVPGDFRQEETKKAWKKKIIPSIEMGDKFTLVEMELHVSSGFYVRQFACDLGFKLGLPALAYSIRRTSVGGWRM